MLKMTVPASSANLGAGFDSLGLALTLYNRVWMEEDDGCRIESADGVAIPTDESNMIYQTAKGLYERCGRPFHGLHIRQENNIPMTRGLGSSSACLVAGLLGANTLLGCPLSEEDLADLAAERERIAKELEKAKNGLRITEGKLANEKFVAHAPENVVNAEREKVAKYQELIAKLEEAAKAMA